MSYTTNLEIQDEIIGKMGLGVDYYKGEQGIPGKDGKTPVKGVDYFTDAEITEIKDEIVEQVQVGAKGEDGKSAYQLAVEAGYEGSETEWLASLKGKDGKDGTNGINGTNGKDGKDGTNGVDGKTPVKGVDYFTTAEIQQIEEAAAAKVDLSDYAKTADLSTVATSGSYNDLVDKPTIPSTTGLATETYVDGKIAEIDIPTVPTKVSAFENDKGYLTEHQSLAEYAKKTEIPAPYELPIASTSTLGGVKVDGSTITITDGVISSKGGSEPDAYIKDASVSGNTLTLTKKDDTEVVFTPSGGGSSAVQGYAFTSGKTLTSEDKAHILEIQSNPLIPMYIDGYVVIKKAEIVATGWQLYLVLKYTTSINNHQLLIYKVLINNGSVSSDKIEIYTQYYLPITVNDITGTILTNTNYSNYINIQDWQTTTDLFDSDLYNAREMIFIYYRSSDGTVTQQYYNFSQTPDNSYSSLGNGYNYKTFYIYFSDSEYISWQYVGNQITFSNLPNNTYNYESLILYKT